MTYYPQSKKPKDASLKIECGFQEVDCDYRGRDGVCNINEEDPNQPCPAGE